MLGFSPFARVLRALAVFAAVVCVLQLAPLRASAQDGSVCGYGSINMTHLANTTMTFYDASKQNKYQVAVCGALPSGACGNASAPSVVCRTNAAGVQTNLGAVDDGWSYLANVADLGVVQRLEAADQCSTPAGPQPFVTFLQFRCAQHAKPAVITAGECYQNITIYTPDACTDQPTLCDYLGDDFSNLSKPLYTYADGTYKYTFSVCRHVVSEEDSGCYDLPGAPSICQHSLNSSDSTVRDLGQWNGLSSARWSSIDPAQPQVGVQYFVQSGYDTCIQPTGKHRYGTTFQFICAPQPSAPVVTQSAPGSCFFTVSMHTPLACGDSAADVKRGASRHERVQPARIVSVNEIVDV